MGFAKVKDNTDVIAKFPVNIGMQYFIGANQGLELKVGTRFWTSYDDNEFPPGYKNFLLNARVAYHLTPNFFLGINMRDLTDKYGIESFTFKSILATQYSYDITDVISLGVNFESNLEF